MSRIGKQPIIIPENVEVKIEGQDVTIKGPKGELLRKLPPEIGVAIEKGKLQVGVATETKSAQALWGLWRTLLNNAILGVSQGFKKELEIVGIGFRGEIKGESLVLQLGFSHPVNYKIPPMVKIEVNKNIILVEGIDKQGVGQVAAEIRSLKKPEPYKGKGIRYLGEEIKLKPGKAGKAVGK